MTMKRLLIIGAGFAGMYAATSAARLRHLQGVSPEELEIALISPEPFLVIRPRLYEANPETMKAPLTELFQATDVRYVQGQGARLSTPASSSVGFVGPDGRLETLAYDRLVLATGSTGFRPNIPGLAEHAFGVEQIDEAIKLDAHLHALAKRPDSKTRNTVVVAGGGFTGIETATEMPERLRAILGRDADIRVVIVERSELIAASDRRQPAAGDCEGNSRRRRGNNPRRGRHGRGRGWRDAVQWRAHRERHRDLDGGNARVAADRANSRAARQSGPSGRRSRSARARRQ